MSARPSVRSCSLAILCLLLPGCQSRPADREEALAPGVHRLTVGLAGDEPAEARLAADAAAICPSGYDRQQDEPMPPDAPRYRVWLVRCR